MILTGWWWFWFGSYHMLLWVGLVVGFVSLVLGAATITYIMLTLITWLCNAWTKPQSRNILHALP